MERYLRDQVTIMYLNTLLAITSVLKTNLVLNQGTLPLINFYLSLLKSINLLIMDLKYEMFFLIFQKRMSKYKGLIFKLKENVISENLLNVMIELLNSRKQRVVLNA